MAKIHPPFGVKELAVGRPYIKDGRAMVDVRVKFHWWFRAWVLWRAIVQYVRN